jgi:Fur family transcriptional regulator, ferric uptake regulator
MAARADGKRSWDEHARSKLAVAGRRAGRARELVITLLAEQQCCLTANEIVDRLRADGRRVGIASVYRALDQLVGLRLVQRLDFPDAARFEPMLPTGEHHHHLVCDDCGRVEAFSDDRLENAIDSVSKAAAFRVNDHDVVLRGRCDGCAA